MNLDLLFLFGIGIVLIITGWFQYWIDYKRQIKEMELVDAITNITKPYNDKRFKECQEMIDYVEKRKV